MANRRGLKHRTTSGQHSGRHIRLAVAMLVGVGFITSIAAPVSADTGDGTYTGPGPFTVVIAGATSTIAYSSLSFSGSAVHNPDGSVTIDITVGSTQPSTINATASNGSLSGIWTYTNGLPPLSLSLTCTAGCDLGAAASPPPPSITPPPATPPAVAPSTGTPVSVPGDISTLPEFRNYTGGQLALLKEAFDNVSSADRRFASDIANGVSNLNPTLDQANDPNRPFVEPWTAAAIGAALAHATDGRGNAKYPVVRALLRPMLTLAVQAQTSTSTADEVSDTNALVQLLIWAAFQDAKGSAP